MPFRADAPVILLHTSTWMTPPIPMRLIVLAVTPRAEHDDGQLVERPR
jgi:hypothetical protein